MFCIKCGAELREQDVFCPKCGNQVQDNHDKQVRVEDNKKKTKKRALPFLILAIVIVLIGVAVLGFYSLPANRYSKQLKLGSKFLEENDYEQAVVYFSEAIEIEPKESEAYLLLADAYIGQGKYDEALEVLSAGSYLAESTEIEEKIDDVNKEIDRIEKEEAERIEQERIKAEEEAEAARIAEEQAKLDNFPYSDYEQGYEPGMVFPDFVMTDVNGSPINLSDYRGKMLYLNLFTTWCPYCFYEIPDMQKISEQYGEDVVIVLLDLAETVELSNQYAENYGITFPINHVDDWLIGTHSVEGVPESFVLNKYGVIIDYHIGMADFEWMDSAVSRAIQD